LHRKQFARAVKHHHGREEKPEEQADPLPQLGIILALTIQQAPDNGNYDGSPKDAENLEIVIELIAATVRNLSQSCGKPKKMDAYPRNNLPPKSRKPGMIGGNRFVQAKGTDCTWSEIKEEVAEGEAKANSRWKRPSNPALAGSDCFFLL
jgi:hypothetical protein